MDRIGVALRQPYSRRLLLQRFTQLVVPAVFLATACQPAAPSAPESKAPAAAPPAATIAPAAPAAAAKPTEAPAAKPAESKPAEAAKPAAAAPTAAPAAQAGAPSDGGTVTLPIQADPTMNPWHPNAFVESIFVNRVLFEGLTKPGKDLAPAPDLATKWEATPDGLTWTFTLRNDVKWSDGQPFTADDVAFTFNDIVGNKDLGANGRASYSAVKNVEVVNPQTVKFNMTRPFSALPSYLAYNSGILPKHSFQGQADPWNFNAFNKGTPVSTGPYKVESYTAGQSVVLARNDAFFGGKPHLDKIVYKVVPDANTQVAQLLSGELSIMVLDNKAAVDRLKASDTLKVEPRSLVQYFWVALNQTDPRFQDVKVRQAFLYAINRKAIVDAVEKGYGKVANTAIPPALASYYDSSLEGKYPYDPDQAKKLLAEAGWTDTNGDGIVDKDGQPFKFVLDTGQRGVLPQTSELIQQDLKKVGIQADLVTMEWNAWTNKVVVNRDYQATIAWWVYPNDPDVFAYFHSSAAGKDRNIPGYKGQKLDEILQNGQSESDLTKRKQIYTDMQKEMAEQLPYLFLWFPDELVVRNATLQGVPEINLRDSMHYVADWSLAKKS